MENKLEHAKNILIEYKQEHIIQLLEKTQGTKREKIIDKILSIDFDELKNLYERAKQHLNIETSVLEPVTAVCTERLHKETIDSYIKAGVEIVSANKFAAVTMAGRARNKIRQYQPKGNIEDGTS